METRLKQFVEHETLRVEDLKECFSPRADRPWWNRWLQKSCFWVLGMLRAFHQETVPMRVHSVPQGTILQKIENAHANALEHFRPGHRLVIGAKTYHELLGSDEVRSCFSMMEQIGHRRQLYDLEIWVVPHVEGWAMIPKKPDVRLN